MGIIPGSYLIPDMKKFIWAVSEELHQMDVQTDGHTRMIPGSSTSGEGQLL